MINCIVFYTACFIATGVCAAVVYDCKKVNHN